MPGLPTPAEQATSPASPLVQVATNENGKREDAEVEEDNSDDEMDEVGEVAGAEKKKKKKKPKKKKKAAPVVLSTSAQAQALQSEPPRVPVSRFFSNSLYPVGEIQEYQDSNAWRANSEEKRHLERLAAQEDPSSANNYNSIRRGAEVHRQVRAYARKAIKPGMTMTEIAELIEDGTRALVEEEGMLRGVGFPTGLSRNHVAAHYTPNAGDSIVLKHEDVLKVDFGVHVSGRILDSAFTMSWTPKYNQLTEAVKEATNAGIKEAGIDVRTYDIGCTIQEVMESYEVEVDGKVFPVKSIRNLTGHSIKPYNIHGSKTIPICKGRDENVTDIMEEGEHYALETFGSTGNGWVRQEGTCSHYAKVPDAPHVPLKMASSKRLMATIDKHFGTLPFCRRYLDRLGESAYLLALRDLEEKELVRGYLPLADVEGSMTAQSEHTFILRPTCKEVVSRGDDY